MRFLRALPAALACCALLPATAAALPAQLPDIAEEPPSQVSVHTTVAAGSPSYQLTFASGAMNVGAGPLRIDGTGNTGAPDYQMTASQLFYDADGNNTPPPNTGIGTIHYVSANHNHFHYLYFQHYELRRPADYALMGIDHKTGFCLGDSKRVVSNPPPMLFQFNWADWCQHDNPTASGVTMGITNGYEDIYDPYLEGQYIAVNGVPAGDYYLVNRANEDRSIVESDYTNDASSALVRLAWPNGPSGTPTVTVLRSCPGTDTCPGVGTTTGEATAVTARSATLHGSVNPNGLDASAQFQYGADAGYGSSTAAQAIGSGSDPVPVSGQVDGLDPNTTYHFRLEALTATGPFDGADNTFTTPALPVAPASFGRALPRPRAAFTVRALRALSGGRARLRLVLPGPGSVWLSARAHGIKGELVRSSAAPHRIRRRGSATFTIAPTRSALAALARSGRLPALLRVAFRPSGGRTHAVRLRLTLKTRG